MSLTMKRSAGSFEALVAVINTGIYVKKQVNIRLGMQLYAQLDISCI